jgi:regulator of sigma D
VDLQGWLSTVENVDNRKLIAKCQEVIDYINSRDDSHLISRFVEFNKKMDNMRSQNFQEVFPELKSLT